MASERSRPSTVLSSRKNFTRPNTRSASRGLWSSMLNGPRTLPKTSTTASTTRWCSAGTSALPVTGAILAMAGSPPGLTASAVCRMPRGGAWGCLPAPARRTYTHVSQPPATETLEDTMTHARRTSISRRRFLALSASPPAVAAAPAGAQTRSGGTFTSAKTTEAPSLDPILEQALSRQRLDPLFYNRVVEGGHAGKLEPGPGEAGATGGG